MLYLPQFVPRAIEELVLEPNDEAYVAQLERDLEAKVSKGAPGAPCWACCAMLRTFGSAGPCAQQAELQEWQRNIVVIGKKQDSPDVQPDPEDEGGWLWTCSVRPVSMWLDGHQAVLCFFVPLHLAATCATPKNLVAYNLHS